MDRKDFFNKIAHSIGDNVAKKLGEVQNKFENESDLNTDQKEFLTNYRNWLHEFQQYVDVRMDDVADIKNNQRLMELSDEAVKRKPMLELYMKDKIFFDHFNLITNNITQVIG